MLTRIELTPAPGRVHVRTASGLLRPQVRSLTPRSARVSLVATHATLLGGDEVDLDVTVGPGLHLDLADVAGTVVYDGRGASCTWRTRVRLAPDAILTWHGEPLVVAGGGHLRRSLDVAVAEGARLLMRDTLALGRTDDVGGELTCRTRLTFDGAPALAEDLELSPDRRSWPGVLGEAKVVDTITALGWVPPETPIRSDSPSGTLRCFELPCAGLMGRALVPRAHLSDVPSWWQRWRSSLHPTPA